MAAYQKISLSPHCIPGDLPGDTREMFYPADKEQPLIVHVHEMRGLSSADAVLCIG